VFSLTVAVQTSAQTPIVAAKNFVVKASYSACYWSSIELSTEVRFCLLNTDSPRTVYEIIDSCYDLLLDRLRHVISWRETQLCSFFRRYPGSNVFLSDLDDAFVYSIAAQKLSSSDAVFDAVRIAPSDIVQKSPYSDKLYVSISSQFGNFNSVLRNSFDVSYESFAAAIVLEKL
jgi:hypothetical protein